MDSLDLSRIERQARRHYEWARAWRAALGFAPVWILVGLACAFTHHAPLTASFGLALFIVGAVMLWYGRDARRAVVPGLIAGMVPFVFALWADHMDHVCTSGSCRPLCMPACIVGGIVAGIAIAVVGRQRRAGVGFWLGASAIAVLIGAMGGTCIGYSGVVGLALGYGAGIAPGLLRKVFGV